MILRISIKQPTVEPPRTADSIAEGREAKPPPQEQQQEKHERSTSVPIPPYKPHKERKEGNEERKESEQKQQQQQEQEQEQQQEQHQHQHTVDIPCHSLILASRSRYFDAALSGAYLESQQKTVELQLADDQAVDDLRLLIKLSCGLSYVQDGDARLPKAVRLRLAFLANALEFVECVQEYLLSLSEDDLTLKDAFALLDDMPEELWEHEATVLIMSKVIKVLVVEMRAYVKTEWGMKKATKALISIIDKLTPGGVHGLTAEEKKKEVVQLAGEALCKALGRADEFLKEGQQNRAILAVPRAISTQYSYGPRTTLTTCCAPGFPKPSAFLMRTNARCSSSNFSHSSVSITCLTTFAAPSSVLVPTRAHQESFVTS